MSDLDDLFPVKTIAALSVGEWPISPLTIGQLQGFSLAISKIGIGRIGAMIQGQSDSMTIISEHTDDAITAAAVASLKTEEEVKALLLDDFILLWAAIVEVNADFFIQRLSGAIQSATGKLGRLIGRTSSSDSSDTGTQSET